MYQPILGNLLCSVGTLYKFIILLKWNTVVSSSARATDIIHFINLDTKLAVINVIAFFFIRRQHKCFYIVIFRKCQSLEASSSPPRGDRHMRPLTFWYKIECLTTFIFKNSWNKVYFWQCLALKWVYVAIFLHCKFQKCQSSEAPSSSPEGDRHMRPLTLWCKIECLTTFI